MPKPSSPGNERHRARRWPILPRWAALLATAIVAGICGYALSHLRLEKDITQLLPARGEDAQVLALARDAGLMKKVLVVVGPGDPGSDRLHRAIDAVADGAARVDGVTSVLGRVDMADAKRAAETIVERGALLYRPGKEEPTPEAIRGRLRSLKERLGAPEAMVLEPFLLADPLGLGTDALKSLEAAGRGLGTTVERGHLFDAGGRYGLVVLTISFDAFDVERSARFVSDLDGALRTSLASADPKAPPLPYAALGGPHFAASSGNAVIGDIGLSFGLALSGIAVVALVLAVFLRKLRLLAVSFLPGGLGIAAGIAAMGLGKGSLHAVTLGFSATITGVSVDYAIHLLHRAAFARRVEGLSTREAMERALGEVGSSIALGAAATVGSFVIVAFSGFTGVREIAVLSAVSVAVAMLGTLVLLPPFHAFLLGGKSASPPTGAERRLLVALGSYAPVGRRRLAVLLVFGAAIALMVVGAARARASGDPQDMSFRDPDLEARKALIAARFPGLQDQALIICRGDTEDAALAANDALYDALLAAGIPPGEVASLSPILPSRAAQDRAFLAARHLLERDDVANAFADAGFTAAYYEDLVRAARPAPASASTYEGTALAAFVGEALRESGAGAFAVTRVRASNAAQVARLQGIAAGVPGARLVSQRLDAERALIVLERELSAMMLIWFGVSFVLLAASRRSAPFAVRALLAPATGVLAAVGLFGALGRPLTPVSVAAATLILGFGVDFGIFAQPRDREEFGAAGLGVVASALTTIAGFTALVFARVGALSDMGLSITAGIFAAFLTAILVVPALSRR